MSYILDALKRAEAERERGAVPGLHAQQVATAAPRTAAIVRSRIALLTVVALVLGGIAAGLWLWRAPETEVNVAAVQPVVVRPSVPAPAVQAPATVPSLPSVVPQPLPAAPPAVVPMAVPAPAAAPTPSAVAQVASPKPLPSSLAKASAAPVAAPAPAVVPLLAELAEDIRRQIPALTVTGAVYSENPAQRLLLVNGLVLSQGAQVAPELIVEEIGVRSSVLSFRGARFRLAH